MKKIFLTGGAGFLGRNIIEKCSKERVIEAPNRQQLELTDEDKVDEYLLAQRFDCIISGANVGGTRNNRRPSLECLNANLRAFANVFKHRNKIQRFIQLGSGAEYSRPLAIPQISEDYLERCIPQDEYGFAKLLCSRMVKIEPPNRAVTLHLFGVFGKHEDYQIRFISYVILRVLFDLPIIINQDVVFDYLYVDDFIRILNEFIDRPAEYSNYNIGGGQPMKLTAIAELIKSVLGSKQAIIVRNSGLGNEYSGNIDRLKSFLGKEFNFTPLPDAIKKLSNWYESQLNHLNKDYILNPI